MMLNRGCRTNELGASHKLTEYDSALQHGAMLSTDKTLAGVTGVQVWRPDALRLRKRSVEAGGWAALALAYTAAWHCHPLLLWIAAHLPHLPPPAFYPLFLGLILSLIAIPIAALRSLTLAPAVLGLIHSSCIAVDSTGLQVEGRSSRRFAWEEIASFSFIPWLELVQLKTRSGERIRFSLQGHGPLARSGAIKAIKGGAVAHKMLAASMTSSAISTEVANVPGRLSSGTAAAGTAPMLKAGWRR